MTKPDARATLASVLKSGLAAPLNGQGVFAALEADAGCGLLDRLIVDDSRLAELTTLTLDPEMGALPQVQRLYSSCLAFYERMLKGIRASGANI